MRKFVIGGGGVVALTFVASLIVALNVTFHMGESFPAFNSNLVYKSPTTSPITRMQAIRGAARFRYGGRKNIAKTTSISARFGSFSNNTMCTQKNGSSKCVLVYQKVPAWIVTFRGPEQCMESMGAAPRPTLTPAQASQCVVHIVIDARTGKALEGFNSSEGTRPRPPARILRR